MCGFPLLTQRLSFHYTPSDVQRCYCWQGDGRCVPARRRPQSGVLPDTHRHGARSVCLMYSHMLHNEICLFRCTAALYIHIHHLYIVYVSIHIHVCVCHLYSLHIDTYIYNLSLKMSADMAEFWFLFMFILYWIKVTPIEFCFIVSYPIDRILNIVYEYVCEIYLDTHTCMNANACLILHTSSRVFPVTPGK